MSITRVGLFKLASSPSQSTITIMRHAETLCNVPPVIVQGQSEDPRAQLSAAGIASIQSQLKTKPTPQVVISSPLWRCQQTYQYWIQNNKSVTLKFDADLMEIHAGIYQGCAIADLKNDILWQQWMCNPTKFSGFPGGEQFHDFSERVMRAFKRICALYHDTGQEVCVITHGIPMRVLKCYLANQPYTALWSHQVVNLECIDLSSSQVERLIADQKMVPRLV